MDFILEGLSDAYKPIRLAAEQNHDIALKEIKTTMRNMYANHLTSGGHTTLSRGKGCKSALTASSGLQGSCDYCNRFGHKKTQCLKFQRESGRGSSPSIGATRNNCCKLRNTDLHDNADCRAQW